MSPDPPATVSQQVGPNEASPSCFQEQTNSPHNRIDNVFQEWHQDTPLDIQVLLECFVNKDSLKKVIDKPTFLRNKITKLYTTLDILLNIFNKNYIGLLQEFNTKEY